MAKKLRSASVVPDVPHHVVLRGNNRRNLFSYARDRDRFLRLLSYGAKRHACAFHHISLLTNHVHFIVTPQTVDGLSKCIKLCAQSYALFRNKQRGGTGKLFEERFFSKSIMSEEYMAVVAAYVDLNPELAGIPRRYLRYSTLGLHAGWPDQSSIPRTLWVPSPWYRALGNSAAARQRRYREWLAQYREHRAEMNEAHALSMQTLRCARGRDLERPDRTSVR